MHIVFLSHYYPPEVNAPASRLSENARAWVGQGNRVTVVTCAPNHPRGVVYSGYRNKWFQREEQHGVEVIRLWTFMAANEGIVLRLLNYLSYFFSVLCNLRRIPPADIVISSSPQFFCGLSGWLLRRRTRPWVLEIRDLWPESIVAVGAMKHGLLIRLLERVERFAYRSADAVVAVTDSFVPHIMALRGSRGPVEVIKNGVDLQFFEAMDGAERMDEFKAQFGLEGKFVAAYVGTHGMAHGLDTILEAAEILKDDERIAFLLVGDGSERARLLELAEKKGLANVHIIGQRDKSDMPMIWQATHASLVLLRRLDTFKSVLPSKMFEAMAMRCPLVLGVEGEALELLDAAGAGIGIRPEDAQQLAAAVSRLANDPALATAMGRSGRAFVEAHFDRDALARRYLGFLRSVVSPPPDPRATSVSL
jgi:colanic acid biosynthesis glycosyl transferase WcaI